MTLFKTAMKNYRKDPVMNIIGFVQLVAVFLVTTVMVSTISIRYRTYDALEDILSSKGFYVRFGEFDGAKMPESGLYENVFYSVDKLNAYFNADPLVAVQGAWVANYLEKPDAKTSSAPLILFYDDELIERCKPVLKSGRWLSKNADKLEIVVSENDILDWKIGETYSLELFHISTYRVIEAEIVGIVENSADIFGYNRFESRGISGDTFRFLYDTHNSHNEGHLDRPTIISSSEALGRLFPEVEAHITSAFFIYDDDTPDEFIKEKAMLAGQFNGQIVDNLDDLNENSKIYLRGELLTMMPVIVILLSLLIISAISVSAIAARRRLKDYAKYYVLGLQWKQCAAVSLFQALTTAAAALLVSAAALFVIGFTPLSDVITVIVDMRLISALLGILLLYLVFSMIMPLMMLKSATPKQLLTTE
ncbi:MAG: hypothetical protein K2N38_09295 [Oscillospiraceae bacterium]|nr:hypothetical protein [Oscillospiraceae bacterium]